MRIIFFALALLPSAFCGTLLDRFEQWSVEFRQNFDNEGHKQHVLKNWITNDKHIDTSNSQNLTYTLGHNHLSGLSSEEFSAYMGFAPIISRPDNLQQISRDSVKQFVCVSDCVKGSKKTTTTKTLGCVSNCLDTKEDSVRVDSEVNWDEIGAVTPVKDQGQCGSCWSFSTTGALEGAYYVKYGSLPSFSEQQLVDCDNFQHGGKDHGCNGGLMDNAFSWIGNNKGLCGESSYPYVSGTTKTAGSCETTCDVVDNSKVVSFHDVSKSSDQAMMEALSQQPVSIAIQADQSDFQLYKSGVFSGACGTQLDHGVLAIGYGSDDGSDYYLVKNSWSSQWGLNGYIKLGRGDEFNNGQGQCGMLLQASYPEL
jgi:C1A family cysteine protease